MPKLFLNFTKRYIHTSTALRVVPNEVQYSRFGHFYTVTSSPLSSATDRRGRPHKSRPRRMYTTGGMHRCRVRTQTEGYISLFKA